MYVVQNMFVTKLSTPATVVTYPWLLTSASIVGADSVRSKVCDGGGLGSKGQSGSTAEGMAASVAVSGVVLSSSLAEGGGALSSLDQE
jgi:hypothetical protein